MDMDASRPLSQPPKFEDLEKRGPLALFLDFDGTLVELAPTPDTISVKAQMASKLAALADRLDGRVALVSGRSIEDLKQHLASLPVAAAGSHGAAIMLSDGRPLGDPPKGIDERARADLRQFALGHGLNLEEKTHGAALHFRSDPAKEAIALTFAKDIAQQHGLAVKQGKCVAELVERGADKGSAVRAFMNQPPFRGASPWFVGDDITDEDGFAACKDLGGGGILVGERAQTHATFALPNVDTVHQWLGFE